MEYSLEHAVIEGEDCLLILHNDGAENYTLAQAPVDATSPEQWEPLLPYDPRSASRTSTRSRPTWC